MSLVAGQTFAGGTREPAVQSLRGKGLDVLSSVRFLGRDRRDREREADSRHQ